MTKQMNKGYKGYWYAHNWILLKASNSVIIPAAIISLILIKFIPPIGIASGIVTASTYIGVGIFYLIDTAISRYHSRKLFEDIDDGNINEIERRLDRINRGIDIQKECIFNYVRDKDGNTLIASIIKSKKITEEKKIELISKMIDNGANICEKNINGKIPIEIVDEEGAGPELCRFLAEKSSAKLDSRETKYNSIIERYDKRLENNRNRISDTETRIEKKEEEVRSGFHPFKKMAIKNLKRKLKRLKGKREYIMGRKAEINSKVKEKITDKRIVLNRILNLNENEEFIDEQIQIE